MQAPGGFVIAAVVVAVVDVAVIIVAVIVVVAVVAVNIVAVIVVAVNVLDGNLQLTTSSPRKTHELKTWQHEGLKKQAAERHPRLTHSASETATQVQCLAQHGFVLDVRCGVIPFKR